MGYIGNGVTPTGTRKYYHPDKPDGPFYYLGKLGNLRKGNSIVDSGNVFDYCAIPTHEDADKMLARAKVEHEENK